MLPNFDSDDEDDDEPSELDDLESRYDGKHSAN